MQNFRSAQCAARVHGKACGQPPKVHAVQRRYKNDPEPIAHAFVIGGQNGSNPKNSRAE